MTLLKHIATVRTGYPFRERIERVADKKGGKLMIPLVQMGDVDASVAVIKDKLQVVQAEKNWQHYVLKPGDVLFIGRGKRNEAATFVGELENVIAAPHLFIIQPTTAAVHSAYLTWFLNLPRTQKIIMSHRRGSSIPFVPMDAMENLEVPLPDLERQKKIAALYALSLEEQRIVKQLQHHREIEINGVLWKAAQQEITFASMMDQIRIDGANTTENQK